MIQKTVEEILQKALIDAGADGLVTNGCLCMSGDLMACGDAMMDCQLGVKDTVQFKPACDVIEEAQARLTVALDAGPQKTCFCMYDFHGHSADLMRPLGADAVFAKIRSNQL